MECFKESRTQIKMKEIKTFKVIEPNKNALHSFQLSEGSKNCCARRERVVVETNTNSARWKMSNIKYRWSKLSNNILPIIKGQVILSGLKLCMLYTLTL